MLISSLYPGRWSGSQRTTPRYHTTSLHITCTVRTVHNYPGNNVLRKSSRTANATVVRMSYLVMCQSGHGFTQQYYEVPLDRMDAFRGSRNGIAAHPVSLLSYVGLRGWVHATRFVFPESRRPRQPDNPCERGPTSFSALGLSS